MPEVPHRAGVVALLGRPNAGKSTLLNRLLGEKLAIVTARPQTTRSRLLGIRDLEGAQVVLVDTPGLHASAKRLTQGESWAALSSWVCHFCAGAYARSQRPCFFSS